MNHEALINFFFQKHGVCEECLPHFEHHTPRISWERTMTIRKKDDNRENLVKIIDEICQEVKSKITPTHIQVTLTESYFLS